MTAKGALPAKGTRRAMLAAAAALVLASCTSSSDPFERLGLLPDHLSAAPSFAPTSGSSPASSAPDTRRDFVVGDVAEASQPAPLQDAQAAVADPAAEAETVADADMAATEQDRQDAALRARMGLDAAGDAPAPALGMVAEAPPQKTGLLAALFGNGRPQQQAAPVTAPPEAQGEAGQTDAESMQPSPAAEIAAAATSAVDAPRASRAGEAGQGQQGLLANLFSSEPAGQAAQRQQRIVSLASTGPSSQSASQPRAMYNAEALPGVRQGALYDIRRRSSIDAENDDDMDLYEGDGSYQVASAAGLARLAPNGLLTQTDRVDVNCLRPALVRKLKAIENRFGKKVVVTSGFRSPPDNRRARGARNSLHMYCAAADIQVPGVDKWQLAAFVRSMPGRGGVGTYCHTNSVHVDVGPERDWNWRCRRRR